MAQADAPNASVTSTARLSSLDIPVEDTTSDSPAVESPSLSCPSARARFEFEPGRGNDGTKILMVEWEDDESTKNVRGSWTVSWEGKSHVLPAEDQGNGEVSEATVNETQQDQAGKEHRLFFMLHPGVSVPRIVTLTLQPESSNSRENVTVWKTNPLPAIFPPALSDPAGASTQSKGVLHTLWAKKRLQTLSKEIEREASINVEGIALAMALREKEWIESSFGVTLDANKKHPPTRISIPKSEPVPASPSVPLSPGGSRLAEKLKGLKIQTGGGDLRPRGAAGTAPAEAQLVSPEDTDVAVPNLAAFRGAGRDVLAAKPAQVPATRRVPVGAVLPGLKTRQESSMASLTGMMSGSAYSTASGSSGSGMPSASASGSNDPDDDDEAGEEEEDLFALPLSPRSPDMTKSPFTFTKADTARYAKAKDQQKVS